MRTGRLFFESGEEAVGASVPVNGSFVRRDLYGYETLVGICADGTRYRTVIENGARDEKQLVRAVCRAIAAEAPAAPSSVLIAGLGNGSVDADSLGSRVAERATVGVGSEKAVYAVKTGVPEQTGIEVADFVRSAVSLVKADLLIAVDSLAASAPERLLSAIQISGAVDPGAGAGQPAGVISPASVGCPVVSVGVPTVVFGKLSRGAEESEGLFTVCGVENELIFYSSVIAEAIKRFAG